MAEGSSGIKELKDYFGMTASEFMKDWKQLALEDKEDLKKGVLDGTLTY